MILGLFLASTFALSASACNGEGGKKHSDPTSTGSMAAMGLEAKSVGTKSVGTKSVEVKTKAVMKTAVRDPMKLYQRSCIACHSGGSAPKSFEPAAWEARLKKGMPTLVNSVMKGINSMPAMGFCSDCSEQEIEAIIRLMIAPKPE